MITTANTYIVEDGSKSLYSALDLQCVPTIHDDQGVVSVEVRVISDAGNVSAFINPVFTNAEIAAFTPSGTTDRDKFFNQVEQAVVDYLEGFSGNSSVTFSIT